MVEPVRQGLVGIMAASAGIYLHFGKINFLFITAQPKTVSLDFCRHAHSATSLLGPFLVHSDRSSSIILLGLFSQRYVIIHITPGKAVIEFLAVRGCCS